MTHTQQKWATSDRKPTAPHYQGQIYDEATGQTVAISYNDEGGHIAALIAAAPALYEALKGIIDAADDPDNEKDSDLVDMIDWTGIREAIRLAERGKP